MAVLFYEALTKDGEKVNIINAQHGLKYICEYCGEPLFPKLRGIERAPHFAHLTANKKCSPERWLHNEIRDLLFDRIKNKKDIAVVRNAKERIDLSNWTVCEKEKKDGPFIPDIYVVVNGVEYYIEICVTHPCSVEKIAFGKRIIELFTDSSQSKYELETGDIICDAEHYSVCFHNFTDEANNHTVLKATSFPITNPHPLIESFDYSILGYHKRSANTSVDDSQKPARHDREPVQANTTVITDSIPFINHYVLYPDGREELLPVNYYHSKERYRPEAQLELGISIQDPVFAKEVGHRYAADNGFISKEMLNSIERNLDMEAIKRFLGYQEIR